MKLKLLSVALVSVLSSAAFANTHAAPKTQAECTAKAKHGWNWDGTKCVKADTKAHAKSATTTKSTTTTTTNTEAAGNTAPAAPAPAAATEEGTTK